MGHNFNDDDPKSLGYRKAKVNAIYQALKAAGFKHDRKYFQRCVLPEITTLMNDLRPNPVIRANRVEPRVKMMQDALEAFLQEYSRDDFMGEALRLHIADQELLPIGCAECARRERQEWEALVTAPTQVEGPGFSRGDMDHQPDKNPYTPDQYIARCLMALRRAMKRRINPMIASVQKKGRTKNLAIHRAVWKLLDIFERNTGIQPKVSADPECDGGIKGNFCAFAIACLAPVNLVPPGSLNSAIRTAYTAWNRSRKHRDRTRKSPATAPRQR